MDELVDVLTEDGIYTGKIITKLEAHKRFICHGISAIGLINGNGQLLIQKRTLVKKEEPGKWDVSSAGHIDSHELPENAAIREMYEELGIKLKKEELTLIDTYLNKVNLDEETYINHFTYLYIVKKNVAINDMVMQRSEVSDIKFVTKEEYLALINDGKMVNGIKFCDKLLDYMK